MTLLSATTSYKKKKDSDCKWLQMTESDYKWRQVTLTDYMWLEIKLQVNASHYEIH